MCAENVCVALSYRWRQCKQHIRNLFQYFLQLKFPYIVEINQSRRFAPIVVNRFQKLHAPVTCQPRCPYRVYDVVNIRHTTTSTTTCLESGRISPEKKFADFFFFAWIISDALWRESASNRIAMAIIALDFIRRARSHSIFSMRRKRLKSFNWLINYILL